VFYTLCLAMKKLFAAFVLFCVFAAVACDSLEKEFTFYLFEKDDVVLKPNFPVGTVALLDTVTIATNADTTFMNNRTRAEFVKEITLDKFSLTITDSTRAAVDSTGTDFDFMQSIDVYIAADGLGEERVAFLEDIPETDSLVFSRNLNLTNAKLDEYLKKDKYTIRTRARLRRAVVKDVILVSDLRFKVIADPL